MARGAPPSSPDRAADEETVRIARRRFARRQWGRRWLAWRNVTVLMLILGAAGGLVWLFFFSSVLAVNGVTVEGVTGSQAQQVRQVAKVPVGSPLARVDLDAIAKRVRSLVVVDHVDVSRAWPDKVRIDVTRRAAVAVVARNGGFEAVDENGVLFKRYPTRPAGLPVVHLAAGAHADAMTEGARVAAAVPSAIAARVDYIEVRTVDEITLHLRGGRTVLWGSADGSAAKAKVIAVLLRHKARFYDISSPGQPVLRR